ncbi:MAG: MBL fold metallo-hydrolase [Chloroflexota bacterium]|nr:MBL fold metallo-hydrolase [Chloroflexota bacterium]
MSTGRSHAVAIADGIHAIDLGFLDRPGSVAAYLVEGPHGLALIETGPSTVRENLEAGIRDAGYGMEDVSHVIVTHIHLDHAGGVGGLARAYSHLRVWVHPVGAPHLIDTSKLVNSAARIYGDDMGRLWGNVEDVPEDQVVVVEDRVAIDVGGRKLVPYFTPGHASHHLALLDEQTRSLFSGDVGGVRMQGTGVPIPPMPPPDIDIHAWRTSIDLMIGIEPERLLLSHFGAFTDIETHLATLRENIDRMMETGRTVLIPDGSDDALTVEMEAWVRGTLGNDADRVWPAFDAANPMFMTSLGIHRVLRKAGELET